MPKKVKQRQKQKQSQRQVVTINLADKKPRAKRKYTTRPKRLVLPQPVHVYTSQQHSLTPQVFNPQPTTEVRIPSLSQVQQPTTQPQTIDPIQNPIQSSASSFQIPSPTYPY